MKWLWISLLLLLFGCAQEEPWLEPWTEQQLEQELRKQGTWDLYKRSQNAAERWQRRLDELDRQEHERIEQERNTREGKIEL